MARNPKVGKKNHKPRPVDGKGRVRRGRPKVCLFCTEHANWVDYKDLSVLRRYVNDRGRIKARGSHRHLRPASARRSGRYKDGTRAGPPALRGSHDGG